MSFLARAAGLNVRGCGRTASIRIGCLTGSGVHISPHVRSAERKNRGTAEGSDAKSTDEQSSCSP